MVHVTPFKIAVWTQSWASGEAKKWCYTNQTRNHSTSWCWRLFADKQLFICGLMGQPKCLLQTRFIAGWGGLKSMRFGFIRCVRWSQGSNDWPIQLAIFTLTCLLNASRFREGKVAWIACWDLTTMSATSIDTKIPCRGGCWCEIALLGTS